jgi:hypothetical protein
MSWLTRGFFLLIAAIAIAGLASETGCTRRGQSTPIPPTASPLTTISVNPLIGSDSTGNGTPTNPYKTLTKAVAVAKNSTTPDLTIALAGGIYGAANGEKFPIAIPTGMTIAGTAYAAGPFNGGSFINGFGEDRALEAAIGAGPGKAFATIEVSPGVAASFNGVYVGSSHLRMPAAATYAAADALGSLSALHATFAAATLSKVPGVGGIIVPSGVLSCNGCVVLGNAFAILAFTVPAGSGPSVTGPSITLTGQPTQSSIGGNVGILTDGSATINASFQTFKSRQYGYRDSFAALQSPSPSGIAVVDFGQGPTLSPGGNLFIGAQTVISEISVTLAQARVFALGNVWNPLTQGSDVHGQYPKAVVFGPGARGRNVTVAPNAAGAMVLVGPIPPQTPSPSPSPSGSPSPSSSPA